jgi:Methyltransferase domain
VDVGGPTLEFAKHRFARRQLPAKFVESESDSPVLDGQFDVIVCFDVFEHLQRPLDAAKSLVGALSLGGVMLQRATFEDEGNHPCHLESGIRHFGGLRWHIQLIGLGLTSETNFVYRKATGVERLVQTARYEIWRATGLWLSYVGVKG